MSVTVRRFLGFFLFVYFCVSFLLPAIVCADDPTPDVPLSHGVYRVFDRFEARGWFDEPLSGIRPFSRRLVGRYLMGLLQRADAGAGLSRTERGILDRYRAEFARELAELGYAGTETGRGFWGRLAVGGDLYAWEDSAASVALNPLFRQQVLLFRGDGRVEETVSQTYVGGMVRGTFRDRFGFRVRHFEAREWSTRARRSREEVVARPVEEVQLKGTAVDFREAAFQLRLATPWFDVDVGKALPDWGPGRSGNLLLTDRAPSFGLVRLRASYGRVRFVHLSGVLRARSGLIDTLRTRVDNGHVRTLLRSKHFAAHRLEVRLSDRVLLGVHESVVYGDRSPEFLYVAPVSVFAAAQSYLGNKDNLAVGLDVSARPGRNVQVYAAVFFDDMVKFDPDAFGNKFAVQAGVFWVNPAGIRDTDLRVEYVRVEPFVYSHNFAINTYEHFDALLGYPSGPNTDVWFGRVTHRFGPAWSLELTAGRERHGANVFDADGTLVENVGGDAAQGRRPSDPRVKSFLSGELETRTRLGVGFAWEPARDFFLRFGYETASGSNVVLPDGSRGDGRAQRGTVMVDLSFY